MLITTYKEANRLQSSCISLPTATVAVVTPHVQYGKLNIVRVSDMHLSCITCVCYPACAYQNRVLQCMYMSVFEVLHELNVQAHACTCMCVKFKLSCTVCS